MNSALLLDRDGVVLVQETGQYITDLSEVRFEIGAVDALVRLSAKFDKIIIITNQACIGKHIISAKEVDAIHQWIAGAIQRRGGHIDAFYVCPHRHDEGCDCRKPNNGLLLRAIKDYDIDIRRSAFIGDTERDMEAGKSIGLNVALVLTGEGQSTLNSLRGTHRMNGVSVYNDLYGFAFDIPA